MDFAKELIIPDIHLNWRVADRMIEHEQASGIWLLGDYFDDYGDTLDQVEQTCQWLQRTFEDDRVHRILGNHDLYYFYENKAYRGAGYSRDKHAMVRKYFSPRTIAENFILSGRTNGYLLTHAGFTAHWLKRYSLLLIDRYLQEAFDALLRDQVHPLLGIGMDRGGWGEFGGITWCDWRYFKPIAGMPQITGHTFAPLVRWAGFERSATGAIDLSHCVAGSVDPGEERVYALQDEVSLCLDTRLRHYAVIKDSGNVVVKQTPDSFFLL